MAGDVHGDEEAVARAVREAAVQIRFRREGDGVERKIDLAPALTHGLEDRLQLAGHLHVAGQEDRRLELARQRLDIGLCLVVEIGDGELRPHGSERLRASPGDGVLVGDAEHQALLAD